MYYLKKPMSTTQQKAYINWSGGKDCSLALLKIVEAGKFNITHLLTSVNKEFNRISMHGVHRSLLEKQAASIGIPLRTIELPEHPSMEEYEQIMSEQVLAFKAEGVLHTVFGDILLEDLKAYREKQLHPLGIATHFPLWKVPTPILIKEFIDVGFKAIVVCVNESVLDASFCGRIIDQSFVDDLPPNVDVCGENGEYHSFVFDGPIFKSPIAFTKGELIRKSYSSPKASKNEKSTSEQKDTTSFCFCDLLTNN